MPKQFVRAVDEVDVQAPYCSASAPERPVEPFGAVTRASVRRLQAAGRKPVDKLTRISYLIGIYKALHILHGRKLADEWIRLPNTNAIFAGQAPLAYMVRGGLPAMQTVRRLLDARRAG